MAIRTNVQRSNVNETNLKFSDFPKSGYDLSYTSQLSGKLGKLLPVGYQYIMPNDKISGETHIDIQFEPTAVPMIAPLQMHTHNFYVPFRDVVGSDFEEFMSPENGYAPDVATLPMFSFKEILNYLGDLGLVLDIVSNEKILDFPSANSNFMSNLRNVCVCSYLGDWYDEYKNHIDSLGSPRTDIVDFDWYSLYYITLLQPFIGEGSYLDMLGYPIFSNDRLALILHDNVGGSFFDVVSDSLYSELPLRCLWSIWFDRYRNVNVERKRGLYELGLNYKKWTAAPLSRDVLFHLLLPRYRNWSRDMFTSAMVDDPSRHVYASVDMDTSSIIRYDKEGNDYLPAETSDEHNMLSHGIVAYDLNYLDENGISRNVTLPIPSSVLSPRSVVSTGMPSLDLLSLRRAKMFENYLKRNFYFGDEYQDRMAAHYGSRVSDSRVNRPEYLSGNTSQVNVQQTIANVNTEDSDAGQKTAYLDAQQQGGDRFDFYCEEFGMVITIMSITPDAFYDPMPQQLMNSKLMDFPFPEFANQNEQLSIRKMLSRDILVSHENIVLRPFGHHPQYVSWRGRVNDLHGNALSTRRWYTFSRVWTNEDDSNTPIFNPAFVHCRPSLDAFVSNDPLNDVWFGYIKHNFYVERVLPQVTEVL